MGVRSLGTTPCCLQRTLCLLTRSMTRRQTRLTLTLRSVEPDQGPCHLAGSQIKDRCTCDAPRHQQLSNPPPSFEGLHPEKGLDPVKKEQTGLRLPPHGTPDGHLHHP